MHNSGNPCSGEFVLEVEAVAEAPGFRMFAKHGRCHCSGSGTCEEWIECGGRVPPTGWMRPGMARCSPGDTLATASSGRSCLTQGTVLLEMFCLTSV